MFNLQDKITPLHSAAMDNNVVAVKKLIKSGESINNVDKVIYLIRTYVCCNF